MSSPDQHLIDELYRNLTNGPKTNGENGHADPGGSKLTDQAVLEMIFSEQTRGEEFRATYHGEYAAHRPDWSNSEAVASILRKIAFYSGNDPVQMERLIRGSALSSVKFNDARGGSTWLANEIQKAIEATPETYQQRNGSGSGSPNSNGTGTDAVPPPELVRFRDIERTDRQKDIVEGLIPANSMTLWYGAGGVAKSYIALQVGMSVAGATNDWLGFEVEHGPVVFADFELDATEHGWRSHRLAKGLGTELPENLYYMELTARKPREAFDALYKACKETKAKLLILDSVTVALEGDVEVARDFIGFVNHQIGRLRKEGVAVLALDHQGKLQSGERYQQKSAFGTSFKRHLSRSYAQLEPRDHGDGFLSLTLRHQKQNFAPLVDPFGIRVEFEPGEVLVHKEELEESELAGEETINARERVYRAIRSLEDEEGTKSDIVETTGLAEGTIKKELAALKREDPPRVWDTGRVEGRQAIITTRDPSGSGSKTYRGTGTGTDSQRPLSDDLKPGETATLEELCERRERHEQGEYEERFT